MDTARLITDGFIRARLRDGLKWSDMMDPTTNPDVQEALSRRYSDDIIMLLPLRSGAIGVFNAARELCGFTKFHEMTWKEKYHYHFVDWRLVKECWHPPAAAPTLTKPPVDLEELDLI